jgi:flagellar biosynthesis/type III secretory pathway protein FliH
MITKKQIAEQFNITINTVRKTLEACGLDTSQSEYSEDDIREKFEVARTMLTEEQKNYAEVAAHFGVAMGDEVGTPESNQEFKYASVASAPTADPLQAAIHSNVQTYVQEITDHAVEDVVAELPQMIFESVRKVVRSGAVDAVFQTMLEQRRAFSRDFSDEGTTIDVSAGGLPFADDSDDEIEITRSD